MPLMAAATSKVFLKCTRRSVPRALDAAKKGEVGEKGEVEWSERGGLSEALNKEAGAKGRIVCLLTLGWINGCLAVSNHCVFPSCGATCQASSTRRLFDARACRLDKAPMTPPRSRSPEALSNAPQRLCRTRAHAAPPRSRRLQQPQHRLCVRRRRRRLCRRCTAAAADGLVIGDGGGCGDAWRCVGVLTCDF